MRHGYLIGSEGLDLGSRTVYLRNFHFSSDIFSVLLVLQIPQHLLVLFLFRLLLHGGHLLLILFLLDDLAQVLELVVEVSCLRCPVDRRFVD